MTRRQARFKARHRDLRESFFPDVTEEQLWERQNKDGFATIPRALPMILVLMDELSPGKPISKPYFSLWCRAWDDPLITIGPKLLEIALESGFTGQRAQNSLCARLAVLEELGFVRFAEGPGGKYAYALLLNPYIVLKPHQRTLSKMAWNALLARMSEIGADDYEPKPAGTENG